jgi:hypothetical protein
MIFLSNKLLRVAGLAAWFAPEGVAVSGLEGLFHARPGALPPLLQPVEPDSQLPGTQIQGLAPEEAEHHLTFSGRSPALSLPSGPTPISPGETPAGLRPPSVSPGVPLPITWALSRPFAISRFSLVTYYPPIPCPRKPDPPQKL